MTRERMGRRPFLNHLAAASLVAHAGRGSGRARAEPSGDSQVELTVPAPLLGPGGVLDQWGWARGAVPRYNRGAIPLGLLGRVKEWEHYTVMSPEFTVGVTIAQLGGLVFGSAELVVYRAGSQWSRIFLQPTRKEVAVLPDSPRGETELRRGAQFVSFRYATGKRLIAFSFDGGDAAGARSDAGTGESFRGQIELFDDPRSDSIGITRPFEPGQFFYENKVFGMPADGQIELGSSKYTLPPGDSYAIFDWGRGIWPRRSAWFWGQAAGRMGQRLVAINLGHGYGDDSRGTANAILVDGRLDKLRNVHCDFDPGDRMKTWRITSDDGRLALDFKPLYHQEVKQDIGLAAAELHKIHGHYSGTLQRAGGEKFAVSDLLGFAEHMTQRW